MVSCLPTCIGGIICGGLALKDTGPDGSKQGRGLALWGLWLGIIFTAIYLAFIGLFAFAIAMEK